MNNNHENIRNISRQTFDLCFKDALTKDFISGQDIDDFKKFKIKSEFQITDFDTGHQYHFYNSTENNDAWRVFNNLLNGRCGNAVADIYFEFEEKQ